MPIPAIIAPVLAWLSTTTSSAASVAASCSACSAGVTGSCIAGTTTIGVIKHEISIGLYHAATSYTTFYTFCTYLITKYIWNKIPAWIKNDVAIQNLLKTSLTKRKKHNNKKRKKKQQGNEEGIDDDSKKHDNTNADDDELTTLTSIIEKLSALFQSAALYYDNDIPNNPHSTNQSTKSTTSTSYNNDSDNSNYHTLYSQQQSQQSTTSTSPTNTNTTTTSTWNIQAALFLYIQLSSQLQQLYPQDRIKRYKLLEKEQDNEKKKETTPKTPTTSSSTYSTSTGQEKEKETTTNSTSTIQYDDIDNDDIARTRNIPYNLKEIFDFAVLAYETDRTTVQNKLNESCDGDNNLVLLQHTINNVIDRPGYLGYFLAINHTNKTLVISIKGTSTIEDVFMDCCGRSVPYNSTVDFLGTNTEQQQIQQSQQHCIEVQAQRKPKIIYNTMSSILDNDNDYDDDENDDCVMDGVEVISGHERIWIEENNHNHHNNDTTTSRDDMLPSSNNTSQRYFLMDSHRSLHHSTGSNDDVHGDPSTCTHNDSNNNNNSSNDIRCHEGILISTRRLANKVQQKINLFVIQNKYQLIICGHSLGAGASCLLGIILQTRFPDLVHETNPTSPTSSNKKQRLHVFAFAPPPVVDYITATHPITMSYITTIVNNADIIPRSSLVNLLMFIEVLKCILQRMEERNLIPGVSVTSTTAYLRQLLVGTSTSTSPRSNTSNDCINTPKLDVSSTTATNNENVPSINTNDLLMHREEIKQVWNDIQEKFNTNLHHPEHLYVPGRVIILFDELQNNADSLSTAAQTNVDNTGSNTSSSSIHETLGRYLGCGSTVDYNTQVITDDDKVTTITTTMIGESNGVNGITVLENNNQSEQKAALKEQHQLQQEDIATITRTVLVTDGTALVLQFFELDSFRFMTDHATISYEDSMIYAKLISPNKPTNTSKNTKTTTTDDEETNEDEKKDQYD